jgi:predicted O-methyltransferase YrrM
VLKLNGVETSSAPGPARRAVSFLRPWLVGVAGSAYLFSVGWTRSKHRAAIVQLCHHFGYHHESREPAELPVVTTHDLVATAESSINVRAIDAVDGNVTDRELITICRIVRDCHPESLFEFGTFDGRTTLNMAVNAAPGAIVYTLDLPRSGIGSASAPIHAHEVRYADKPESGERYRGTEAAERIIQLYGDSGNFDFTRYYELMDLVFIDASHMFEYVINDSVHAMKMMKQSGGTILWHDYGRWDGVTSALNELRRRHRDFASLARLDGTTLAVLRVAGRDADPRPGIKKRAAFR